MARKSNRKTFRLKTIIDGHLITGTVAFSPAPQPGILSELARIEAERLLVDLAKADIAAGLL